MAEAETGGKTGAASGGGASSRREGKRLEAGDTLQNVMTGYITNVTGVRYFRGMRTLFVPTNGDDKQLQAIDVQTSTITKPAPQNADDGVTCMDFNADQTRACTNAMNGMVRMYDTTDISAWKQLWGHSHKTLGLDLRFTFDGKKVVTANLGGHLTVHDAETHKVVKLLDLQMCPDMTDKFGLGSSIAVSAELLVGSGGFNTPDAECVKIWRFADLETAPRELIVVAGAGPVALSPDAGQLLAVGTTEGGEVRVYTIEDSTDSSKWSSVCIEASNDAQCRHCVSLQFSFGGKLLAAAWGNSTVSVFDVQTSAKVAHYGGEGKIANWAGFVLAFSPDDSLLVAGGMKEPAVIHQLAPIQPTRRYATAVELLTAPLATPATPAGGPWVCPACTFKNEAAASACAVCVGARPGGGGARLGGLSFAAMSTEHVALVHGSLVVVQSRETGVEICRIEAKGTVKACAGNQPVAVCATHVAFVSMQAKSVALHELPSGRLVVWHVMSDIVQGIVFSADGSKLLVGDFNTGAHVFETATGKRIECVRATEAKSVEDANFVRLEGADKELMAVGSSASSLQLIDIQKDKVVLELGDRNIPGKYASWCCTDDAGFRIGFYTTLSGSSEVVCISVKDPKREEELMRVPAICDSLTRGFAPGTESSLLLCAPFKQDLASWTGSRLSVLDVNTQQETDWSRSSRWSLGSASSRIRPWDGHHR